MFLQRTDESYPPNTRLIWSSDYWIKKFMLISNTVKQIRRIFEDKLGILSSFLRKNTLWVLIRIASARLF